MTIRRNTILSRVGLIGLTLLIGAMSACAGPSDDSAKHAASASSSGQTATAIFAGGCFWCMVHPFDQLSGVISVTSGYTGGNTVDPTYEQVSSGSTGHAESVQIIYDPSKIGYAKILDVFWHNIDPLAVDAQFCDHGDQYRSAIFTSDAEQQKVAEESKAKLQASGRFDKPIATQIVPASAFYPAEDYHQDYYKKNPVRYKFYRFNCGRDARLEEVWGPSEH
ncbi:MAG: peptide-methionine (S)-S-oxide reductase MsrA [Dokdonella sp.]